MSTNKLFSHKLLDGIHVIEWKSKPIPKHVFAAAQAHIHKEPKFAIDRSDIEAGAIRYGITLGQYKSLFETVTQNKNISAVIFRKDDIAKAVRDFKSRDLVEVSREWNLSPLSILRHSLLGSGFDRQTVNDILAQRMRLSGRLLDQYLYAVGNDIDSYASVTTRAHIGAQNEELFVKFFKNLGVKLQTQEDLVEQQTREHGRAVATPDIVFDTEVIINGTKIKWIDYKDYIGTSSKLFLKKNAEQAQRYNATFGHGAFCFRYSFVEGLDIGGATLLSAESLGIDFY